MGLYERIAEVCHEANRAYCLATIETTAAMNLAPIPWEYASDWEKQSVIRGVKFRDENPGATPEDQHKAWLVDKQNAGWTYGPVKDTAAREHPCMVEYDELPAEQRAKDHIFQAIASTLLRQDKELERRVNEIVSGNATYPPVRVQHHAQ